MCRKNDGSRIAFWKKGGEMQGDHLIALLAIFAGIYFAFETVIPQLRGSCGGVAFQSLNECEPSLS